MENQERTYRAKFRRLAPEIIIPRRTERPARNPCESTSTASCSNAKFWQQPLHNTYVRMQLISSANYPYQCSCGPRKIWDKVGYGTYTESQYHSAPVSDEALTWLASAKSSRLSLSGDSPPTWRSSLARVTLSFSITSPA